MNNQVEVQKSSRMTRQRMVILEELRKMHSHPTADELYQQVRQRLPRISLGTVYRNLELLTQDGQVRTLQHAGQKRFDGDLHPHYHFRCVECQALLDAPVRPKITVHHPLGDYEAFEVQGHYLEFYGLCPACRDKQPAVEAGSES